MSDEPGTRSARGRQRTAGLAPVVALPRRALRAARCGIDADGALATAVGGPLDPTVSDELMRLFGRRLRLIELPAGEIQAAILSAQRQSDTPEALSAAGLNGARPRRTRRPAHARQPGAGDQAGQRAAARRAARAEPVTCTWNRWRPDCACVFASMACCRRSRGWRRSTRPAVISRIKIMAGLDIAERRAAAGRPRPAARWRSAKSTCACPRCPRCTAKAWCCAFSITPRPRASWASSACRPK